MYMFAHNIYVCTEKKTAWDYASSSKVANCNISAEFGDL